MIRRRASSNAWTLIWLALIALSIMVMLRDFAGDRDRKAARKQNPSHPDLTAVNLSEQTLKTGATIDRTPQFPVEIRRPIGPPVIELEQPDPLGRVGRLSCSTCHSVRPPNRDIKAAVDLKEFHQGLPLMHGPLTCYACHNPDDMDTLRRADGSVVLYSDVMTLCAQCHGSQASDYQHQIHGGMNGYWDLTRGARVRNNCIDCHDPHAPRFPSMVPTFKPRDRFLKPTHTDTREAMGSELRAQQGKRDKEHGDVPLAEHTADDVTDDIADEVEQGANPTPADDVEPPPNGKDREAQR